MQKTNWRKKINHLALFLPLRFYFLLFAAGIVLSYWWISHRLPLQQGAYADVTALLLKIAAWFIISLLTLGFLSAIIPYFMFRVQRNRGRVRIQINHQPQRDSMLQKINLNVSPLHQPWFGFLHYRFLYDGHQQSPKFALARPGWNKKLFSNHQSGFYQWPLPTIREYDIEKLVVYFEDIFQFFSFSLSVPLNQQFYTKPQSKPTAEQNITPKKTEAENIRIEELRRVEGEYLNYKNFEDNDDVRRIVWKIYAKNGELVVRTPEIFDPVASHIYFYCSYYDSIGIEDSRPMQTRGLNYFKNICWSIYSQLRKNGSEIKYIPDQYISNRHLPNEEQQVEYSIATSLWQYNKGLSDYVNSKNASVLCISSLTNATEVQQLLEQTNGGITIVLVKLTKGLHHNGISSGLRWLFLQEEKDKDKTSMIGWNLSAVKRKIIRNEKQLETLLKKSEAKLIIAEK